MTAISVTAGHIAKGFARDCEHCPVALALRDAFPEVRHISVTSLYVRMGIREHELPAEVQQFTWEFDTGQPVGPFTFELDYPAVTA